LSSLLIADVQKPTNRSATSTLETIASLNLRKDVCAITTDTLLVYGARDITVPVSQYKCLEHNANPHVRLYRISGSRHLPFIEKREEFSRVVRDFLVSRVPAGV
jgi:pimeloyl-ACP methyl ester carboxylesterase